MGVWIVENQQRIIFKPQSGGYSLIDITIDCKNTREIIHEVEKEEWTRQELMDYLDQWQGYECCQSS